MKLALEIVLTDMTLKWCTLCNSYLELVLIALKIIVSLVFILLRAHFMFVLLQQYVLCILNFKFHCISIKSVLKDMFVL